MKHLYIAALNSGSNANCYYVGNDEEAVLVDAGLSCRETEKRMKQLGLDMQRVKALFISHEHADHIAGVAGICKKYSLPLYITNATKQNVRLYTAQSPVFDFTHGAAIQVGTLIVEPFQKSHDAADPYSFVVHNSHVFVGVMTDIGHACQQVKANFSRCHAVFLESNYCADMLAKGSYPVHLKRRISGSLGHLSNDQAFELCSRYKSDFLQLLILSHLSQNNNTPQRVEEVFGPYRQTMQVVVASRHAATELFKVAASQLQATAQKKRVVQHQQQQLSLF